MTKSTITREPITHDIKIYPEFFSAVCTGVKRAELRKNDRDYRVGDTLHLMETPRGSCHQTGEFINVKITHIADIGEWIPGYVLLSVELQERRKADSEPVAENIRIADALEGLLWPNMALGNKAVIQAAIGALRTYHTQPAPVVPNGLRLALSNAGIAAPESDEMLAATCEKHIQALVTWVKDRKPFQSAPVVPSFEEWLSAANRKPLGWVKDAMREAYDACRAAMLQAGNSPVIPEGLIAAVNRLLDSDGSRGCYSAIQCGDAHDEIERLLAAAPQEVK